MPEVLEERRVVTRRVSGGGRISLATFKYYVGRWLEGETVEVAVTKEGLIEISHRGVLVGSHVRQHPVEAEPAVWRRQPKARPSRPQTVGRPVIRKVDSSGHVSFAGANYRVGNAYRRQQVEVRVVGDTVEISQKGRVVRTHPIRHDPDRAHGAFANPGGRPRRINAAG
ncbi:MAG: Mu transposase domain-containing protein [Acidimicrobiia bacterium]